MGSVRESAGAEMNSVSMSTDLLTQFHRTLVETTPGQMQADLQTILAASMSMGPSVRPNHCLRFCSSSSLSLRVLLLYPLASAALAQVKMTTISPLSCQLTSWHEGGEGAWTPLLHELHYLAALSITAVPA